MRIRKGIRDMKPIISQTGEEIYEMVKGKLSSTAKVRLKPGIHSPKHKHTGEQEETYIITEGHGLMIINRERHRVIAGDVILISPGDVHQIFNDSDDDLWLFVPSAPPFDPKNFHEVE